MTAIIAAKQEQYTTQQSGLCTIHVPKHPEYDKLLERLREQIYVFNRDLENTQGAYGRISIMFDLSTRAYCAGKVFLEKHLEHTTKEVRNLKKISGIPHAIQYKNCAIWKQSLSVISPVILMDFINEQNLTAFAGKLSLDQICTIAMQSLEFLTAMKERRMVHGDLKPNNMIFCPKMNHLTVIDFNLSTDLSLDSPSVFSHIQSPSYRAPEVFLGINQYDESADMWSLGCILYELYVGETLFKDQWGGDLFYVLEIIQMCGVPPSDWLQSLKRTYSFFLRNPVTNEYIFDKELLPPKSLRKIIQELNMLKKDCPLQVAALIDLIEKMLTYQNRITPKEALKHDFFKREIRFQVHVQDPAATHVHTLRIFKENTKEMIAIPLQSSTAALRCLHLPKSADYSIDFSDSKSKSLIHKTLRLAHNARITLRCRSNSERRN